jgi:ferrous iron transport protein B
VTSPSPVHRVALLGNVNVGKSTLFDRLCRHGDHEVKIPGSTVRARRGVLQRGSGAAPRAVRRECAHCQGGGGHSRRRRRNRQPACCESAGAELACAGIANLGAARPAVVTHIFDTPGSTTFAATSEDEMVARDLLLAGLIDTVVLVADASNLRRSLALALEVAEFGLPMVLVLNMIDEAETAGIEVDHGALSRELGVDVVRTSAIEGIGIRRLAERMMDARRSTPRVHLEPSIEEALVELENLLPAGALPTRAMGLMLLAGDRQAENWLAHSLDPAARRRAMELVERAGDTFSTPLDVLVTDAFLVEAEAIAARVARSTTYSPDLLVRIGHWAQRPFPGLLIAAGVVVAAYYWVGAFGATLVVDTLSKTLFDGLLIPLCERAVAPIPSAFVRDMIMDPDFGLLPTGLFLAVGLVLPVLFCFYLLQAVLEDSGYLPRLSVLLDRLFRGMGLNGQGLIPLVLGFSCVTMAIITTRMLPTRKERLLLTWLLILGVPCAPLLAVMLVILGHLPPLAWLVVAGVLLGQVLLAGYAGNKLIPGALPDLILEIPRMRVPRPAVVLRKTWRRTWHFMEEALPIFLAASVCVFLVDRAGGLDLVERLSRPLVRDGLGLPPEAVQVFIKTAIRREAGATELNMLREQFTPLQLVVTMVVMTTLIPCLNSVIVLFKERTVREAGAILSGVVLWSLMAGAVVHWTCRALGISFGG